MTHVLLSVNPNIVGPGWIAFVVVMLLIAATLLLWRNMNRQLHKIDVPSRADFQAMDAQRRTQQGQRQPLQPDQPDATGASSDDED